MQTLPGGVAGGKHRLLFPGQLLHFALNKSVDKIQQQPREQRPEPKKIPPSAVKALARSPHTATPLEATAPGPVPHTQADKKSPLRHWAPAEQRLQRSQSCTVIIFAVGFSSFVSPRHMQSPQQKWGGSHLSRRSRGHCQTPALACVPYINGEMLTLTETQIKRLRCLLLIKSDIRQESLTRA